MPSTLSAGVSTRLPDIADRPLDRQVFLTVPTLDNGGVVARVEAGRLIAR
jgi:hypothetical protein